MSIKMFTSISTRFGNVRNIIYINNLSTSCYSINNVYNTNLMSKQYCTAGISQDPIEELISPKSPEKKINKAMKVYLERSSDYKKFIEKQIAEFDIGKRYLAKMMGEDPDKFTQEDINKAISYLFPTGIYDKLARPIMYHPTKLYKSIKEAAFDENGRPHHFLYYTGKPCYYEQLHKIAQSILHLNKIEDKKIALNYLPTIYDKADVTGTIWLTKDEIEKKIDERITDSDYNYFINSLERLIQHPVSKYSISFIMEYRKAIGTMDKEVTVLEIKYDSDNRAFVLVENAKRKSSIAEVKIFRNGCGNISINGKDITYFDDIQCREQMWLEKASGYDGIFTTKVLNFEINGEGGAEKNLYEGKEVEIVHIFVACDLSWSPRSQVKQCVQGARVELSINRAIRWNDRLAIL